MTKQPAQPDQTTDDTVSRSQKRREALDVLDLAKQVTNLPAAKIKELEFDEVLLDAIIRANKITAHVARKREVQFVAKLLRRDEEACEVLRDRFDQSDEAKAIEAATHQRLERWRDRLLAEGNQALTELLDAHPNIDAQHIRQLIRQANREAEKNKPPKSSRALFQLLRAHLVDAP